MISVTTHEAKTRLSQLIAKSLAGETVVICRGRQPQVQLKPVANPIRRNPLKPHPVLRRMRIDYDPTEPLTDDEWPEDGA
jgi:antitoxin (DNA-binding transcriptional repressor) of toxin-antitoxin stability system